jgi:hypothetical protein
MDLIVSRLLCSQNEAISILFKCSQSSWKKKLKLGRLVEQRRNNLSSVVAIDSGVQTITLLNESSVPIDSNFLYIYNLELESPFTFSIKSFVSQDYFTSPQSK